MGTQLTDEQSIEQIISEMTLEEKARLVTGGAPFATEALEQYGIPAAILQDGGTGFNAGQYATQKGYEKAVEMAKVTGRTIDWESLGAMGGMYLAQQELSRNPLQPEERRTRELGCYPPGMLLGATWNPEPIEACGHALGREMSALGVDCVLGTPNVNIHRDPLNGRLFEGYSEDPYLVAQLAPALVRGVQAEGPAANVKHFAANNQETNRQTIDEHISERALREIYFPGFRACVEAGCKTVMSAYNKINGTYCAMNHWLLQQVLRQEWGFQGFVMSDWSAAVDQVAAVAAGNDLAMPGPRGIQGILEAVEKGTLREEQLDTCIRNYLQVLLTMPVMQERVQDFDIQEAIGATEFAAREGITLLQNDGTLPLSKEVQVAFYGKRSIAFQGSGAGSAAVDTTMQTNPVNSTKALIGAQRVTYGESTTDTRYWIVTVGANGREGSDRPDMEMEGDDRRQLERALAEAEAAGGKVILILNTCGPVSLMDYKDRVAAILCAYYPGMQGGKVLADILYGEVNPSGKLPLTYPKYYWDCPTYKNFPGDKKEVWYGEGIYVGYRYYDAKQIEPLYPFGFGLSYTTFEIKDLQVADEVDVETGDIPVQVTVANTGVREGSEVVQLYVKDVESPMDKPEKELKAFRKVFLKAGEEQQVSLVLRKSDLASFSVELDQWVTEPGAYELLVGNSAAHISLRKTVRVKCANPYVLGAETGIGEIAAYSEAVELINATIQGDISLLAADPLEYNPAMSLCQVWELMLIPHCEARGWSADYITKKWEELLAGLAQLSA